MSYFDFLIKSFMILIFTVVGPSEAEVLQDSINSQETAVYLGESKIIHYPIKNNLSKLSQFRCWQQGKLIIDEVNFIPIDSSGFVLLKQGANKLRVHDFGETFCLFIGE